METITTIAAGELVIAEATVRDIPLIQEIYAYHVLNGLGTFEEVPPNVAAMAERYTKITTAGYPFLVAKRNGLVVGYAYAGAFRERSAYRFTVEDSIYIAPKECKAGIGKLLLSKLIWECQSRGCRQMIAVIGDSNNLGSINLHKKLGFELTGSLKDIGFKFGQFVDVVILQYTFKVEM